MEKKAKWKVVTVEDNYGLECENCKHKISLVDLLFADISTSRCPFCNSLMDLEIDEDELMNLSEGLAT